MIVDCHTHLNFRANDADIAEHLAAIETVDECIVLANPEGPSEEINKKLAEYTNKFSDKMVGFAFVEPTKDKVSIKSLTSVTEKLGLKGVVLYCSDCGFHPAHTSNAVL